MSASKKLDTLVSLPSTILNERYLMKVATSRIDDTVSISILVYDLLTDMSTFNFFTTEEDAYRFIEMFG